MGTLKPVSPTGIQMKRSSRPEENQHNPMTASGRLDPHNTGSRVIYPSMQHSQLIQTLPLQPHIAMPWQHGSEFCKPYL